MATKQPNRDRVLRGILLSLVNGWGYSAVRASLEDLHEGAQAAPKPTRTRKGVAKPGAAVSLVEQLSVPPERKASLRALAIHYDAGSAFPRLSDARAFLLSHQRDAKNIKSRSQAFKRMLPLLTEMSEKGLEKVISRSRHSGPAELDPISRAIRSAGETMRGSTASNSAPSQDDIPWGSGDQKRR